MSLNSKKSWHPAKAINKAKVSKLEEDELSRRNLEELRRQELDRERETVRLREQAGGKSPGSETVEKLAWIYETKQTNSQSSPATPHNDAAPENAPAETPGVYGSWPKGKTESHGGLSARKQAADPLAEILKRSQKRKADRARISKRSDKRGLAKK